MDRRRFLTILGIGAAEVICVRQTVALDELNLSRAANETIADPVKFRKYAGRRAFYLLTHRPFRQYIEANFPGVKAPFHGNQPLWHALWSWMQFWGDVELEHHRFLIAAGHMYHVAENRAMIWVDTTRVASGKPLTIASFLTLDDSKTLWVVGSRPIGDSKSIIPHHFTMTMSRWLRSRSPKQDGGRIRKVVFYDPEGAGTQPNLAYYGIKPYRTMPSVKANPMAFRT